MERKPDIDDQVNAALESAQKIQSTELPYGFSDKVMRQLHAKENTVRYLFTLSPLLKAAAMCILILINIFTLKLALSSPVVQNPAQFATIKDFVNEYQINDSNEEIVITTTTNSPAHE